MTDNWFWNVDFVLIKSTEWNWIAKLNSFRWSYIVMYLLYLLVLWKIDVLFLNMVCKEISLNSIFKGNWKSLKNNQICLKRGLEFCIFSFFYYEKKWNFDVWSRLSICCFIHMPWTETLAWKIEFVILICRQRLGCDYYSIQEYCKTSLQYCKTPFLLNMHL